MWAGLGQCVIRHGYGQSKPGIKKGDAKAIEAGVRVLTLKAKVLGYSSPEKVELTGTAGAPIPVALVQG